MVSLRLRIALWLVQPVAHWAGMILVHRSEFKSARDELRKLDRYARSVSNRRRRTTWSRRRILQRTTAALKALNRA